MISKTKDGGFMHFLVFCLKQGVAVCALNLWFSWLSLPTAVITTACHHDCLPSLLRTFFLFWYVWCCTCMFVCASCVYSAWRGQKNGKSPWTGVTDIAYHVGAGNQIWVLWKGSKCFKPPSISLPSSLNFSSLVVICGAINGLNNSLPLTIFYSQSLACCPALFVLPESIGLLYLLIYNFSHLLYEFCLHICMCTTWCLVEVWK